MQMLLPSHEKTDHVASHFDHHNLRNAIMPLMTLLALHATDAVPMASHQQKVMLHLI